jgi:nitronate monooxygenase
MERFGLDYPIVQAAPGGERLAVAVAKAGGLGALGVGWMGPDEAFAAVSRMVENTRGNFYGNFVLHFDPVSLDRVLEAGCPTVQFALGLPSAEAVSRIRKAGARLGIQVSSRQNAERALELLPDFLICQGLEAGGHVQATSYLDEVFPEILEVAKDVPVLVAGGISTGIDIREALGKGAAGVVLGTRFVATQESDVHTSYKKRLVDAGEHSTAHTHCFNQDWDAMHRVLRNDTFINWEAAGCPPNDSKPGAGDIVAQHPQFGPAVRYGSMPPLADHAGDVEDMAMYAGMGVSEILDVPPVAELIERLWRECEGSPVV